MDDGSVLDILATEMQLNHPGTVSLVTREEVNRVAGCSGCGARLVDTGHDDCGRTVNVYECGHRYTIGNRTVLIDRITPAQQVEQSTR